MVFVYCPNLPPNRGLPVAPYKGDGINQMSQEKGVFYSSDRITPPNCSSVQEMNQWLQGLETVKSTKTVESVRIPDYLMEQAITEPGSIDLSTWLEAMKTTTYEIREKRLRVRSY